MHTITVVAFKVWNQVEGDYVVAPSYATREALKAIRAAIELPETAIEVDASAVDGNSHVRQ